MLCLRFLTCIQQLPKPRLSAAKCKIIAAMEQSSIHTSDKVSSPQTTTAREAFFRKADPLSLQRDSLVITSTSCTKKNFQGLFPREEGDRNTASFRSSIEVWAIRSFLNFRMLLLFLISSSILLPSRSLFRCSQRNAPFICEGNVFLAGSRKMILNVDGLITD